MVHSFDPGNADGLEDPGRFRFCSRDELIDLLSVDSGTASADLGSGTGFYTIEVARERPETFVIVADRRR